MKRVLADLPDEDIAWLDGEGARDGRACAALLWKAVVSVEARLTHNDLGRLDAGFGAWRTVSGFGDMSDGSTGSAHPEHSHGTMLSKRLEPNSRCSSPSRASMPGMRIAPQRCDAHAGNYACHKPSSSRPRSYLVAFS